MSWPASFAASGALHAGLLVILVAAGLSPFAYRGRHLATDPAEFVFTPPEPRLELSARIPREPEEPVTVEATEEEPQVRPLEPPPERIPEPRFRPVDLDPSPLEGLLVVVNPPPAELQEQSAPAEPEQQPAPAPQVAAADTAPVPIATECSSPSYPMVAARRGWSGTVLCRMTVGSDGSVMAAWVQESSGYGALDLVALDCIRGWRFRPGTRGGRPTAMDVLKRVEFRL